MMDKARALLKEERYEEAKTALLAAKRLAEKAKEECEKKRKEEEERKRREAQKPPPEPAVKEIDVARKTGPAGMVTIRFGFNDASLTDEARDGLSNNAEYLNLHDPVRVQVEGHCDERGSTEYNLALGERRALAVKSYLVKLGVDPDRIEIISYGEERPVDPAPTEEAWSQNRRAEFRELK
jgi:peptidoglycan-associated lipoprotein